MGGPRLHLTAAQLAARRRRYMRAYKRKARVEREQCPGPQAKDVRKDRWASGVREALASGRVERRKCTRGHVFVCSTSDAPSRCPAKGCEAPWELFR